ncbi:uncharacterized protein LOC124368483 [Homalodisca vitripennis]|uniref:uncharacterized protein LOC124368483 n=1 Tax=Homalodisca vitripennis TaxID=197043 RepID=UPI001EEC421B|nr:uncharacterized protein LOC124368483 [Homalodisca vitripennis]
MNRSNAESQKPAILTPVVVDQHEIPKVFKIARRQSISAHNVTARVICTTSNMKESHVIEETKQVAKEEDEVSVYDSIAESVDSESCVIDLQVLIKDEEVAELSPAPKEEDEKSAEPEPERPPTPSCANTLCQACCGCMPF